MMTGAVGVLLGGVLLAGSLPWAITPMVVCFWIYWQYIGGAIGPRELGGLATVEPARPHSVSGDL